MQIAAGYEDEDAKITIESAQREFKSTGKPVKRYHSFECPYILKLYRETVFLSPGNSILNAY